MSKHLKFMRPLVLVALLASPLQAADAVDADTVVATVNGQDITVGQMVMVRSSLPEQYLTLPDDALFNGILDQIIQQSVLANSYEGSDPKRLKIALASERRLILADTVVGDFLESPVSDEELRAAYNAKFEEYQGPTEYDASHILVDTQEEADAIRAEIVGGADFATMAKEKSTGPSGPSGGALGWFGAGAMVPAFETAVTALSVGEVSNPVKTQFGWHLIILNDTRVDDTPTFDENRGELMGEVQGQKLDAFIASLTTASDIDRSMAKKIDPSVIKQTSLLDN